MVAVRQIGGPPGGDSTVVQQHEFEVWYEAVDFPTFDTPRTTRPLVFSVDALAHALFTTGRAPGDTTRHGWTSVYEWLHRVALIPAYVRRSSNGWLVRSDLARELDQSEKVALSYTLGQGMTGIFSTHVLSVRYLMHVDRYAGQHNIVVDTASKRRADFFGQRDTGEWVVAEAKGRSSNIDTKVKNDMRIQKRTIRTVQGQVPLAYGCAAYFAKDSYTRERLRLYAVDPDAHEQDAVDLRPDSDKFIQAYYEPFLAALEVGEPVDSRDDEYISASFGPFGLRVGLMRSVADRVVQARDGRLRNLHRDVTELLGVQPRWERPGSRFADGTLVAGKWIEVLAQQDWGAEYDEERWWFER